MAYNLQSLITILEQILDPERTRWILDDHNKPQLESLLQRAASLQHILEKQSLLVIESLESQIRDAAHKAEDIIEAQMVDQMLPRREGVSITFPASGLQQVTQELDSAMERVLKLMEGNKICSGSSWSGSSLSRDPVSKSVVVGVDADLVQLKDRLTGMQSKLEIIPIVGMGGIGKTTLARKLYQDPLIVEHFDIRAWTAVSQNYTSTQAIISDLVRCIDGKEHDAHIESDDLYKSLYGRRYLIVLDDIWSTQVWDSIWRYFPDNNNGSRVVITTRESDVAKHADSRSLQHEVQLLSKSDSWNLLRQIVFEEDDCPYELQEIGEKIASDCGGLPLAINVIGGLLFKLQRSENVWKNIAKHARAAIAESDEQFSNILSLSYNHLPNHLKPCFLYMGAFPEDCEVKASKLVRLWVAEGFVKSNGDKSLEEEAEDYLSNLLDRNLLMLARNRSNGKPLSYKIHDLLRDLCIRKANEEKFLQVLPYNPLDLTFSNMRRVSVYPSHEMVYEVFSSEDDEDDECASEELMPLARTYLSTVNDFLASNLFELRLLRVFDALGLSFKEAPAESFRLFNLRYLAFSSTSLPPEISILWNLRTLIAKLNYVQVPCGIWEMPELRHLELSGVIWIEDEHIEKFVEMKKLQTISSVGVTSSLVRRGFFECIPNIKKMAISCPLSLSSALDLSHLHKLKTLRCESHLDEDGCRFLATLKFPSTLRKLTLVSCVISPRVMTTLCTLPNLEVLKIRKCVFESEEEPDIEEWEAAEGDVFTSLRFLQLESLKLVRWRADETNFPRLRQLVIRYCSRLEEIPSGIGEIPTLELIELELCNSSSETSARQIHEVQQSEFDNHDLQLRIRTREDLFGARWRKYLDMGGRKKYG